MKNAHETGFPTLGELIHFLYKASGVLPDKRDPTLGMDEKQRKTAQKSLERLAAEQGNYHARIGDAITQLASFFADYVHHTAFCLAIGEVLHDLLEVYRHVVEEQGTYLSRRETLRWMISEHWVPAAAFSIAKQVTKFGLRSMEEFFPEDRRWYLPDANEGNPTWPLSKVMRWVYDQAGVPQTQFHYPNRTAAEDDGEKQRDLENAQNWVHGRHFPSATTLDRTFRRGFTAQGSSSNLTASHQEASCIVLFLARCISYTAAALHNEFGKEFLVQMCEKFGHSLAVALKESMPVEHLIDDLAQRYGVTPLHPELRSEAVTHWCRTLQDRTRLANAEIETMYGKGMLNKKEIDRLAQTYGQFPVLPAVEQLRNSEMRYVPPEFIQALGQGMTLSQDRALSLETIKTYEAALRDLKMESILPWMVPWLRFQVFYRQKDDINAWNWIQKAFRTARYRAGNRQYAIVNHFVELAAKRRSKREFKKGIHWANYIGIEIRLLRNQELNNENLDNAMDMLRHIRYPV